MADDPHHGTFRRLSSLLSDDRLIAFQTDLLGDNTTPRTRAYLLANLKRPIATWVSHYASRRA